jgi:hypothetical protein
MIYMLAFASAGSCQTETRTVGVKAGDWIKYKVTKLGVSNLAWIGYSHTVWIELDVLNVSGMTVTYRETLHEDDGDKSVFIESKDVCDTESDGYFIGADLEPGDKVGEKRTMTMEEPNQYVSINLTITNTENRSYSGVTRVVNVLKFSWFEQFIETYAHFTLEKCWDKQVGVMLEKKITGYLLGYPERGYNETNPEPTCIIEIADTNMWEMETETSFPWQLLAVTIPVLGVVAAAVIVKVRNNRKKNLPS